VSRITSNILKLCIALSLVGRGRSDYLLQLSNMNCVNLEVSTAVILHHIPDEQPQPLNQESQTPRSHSLSVMQGQEHHKLLYNSATSYARLPTGSYVGTIHPVMQLHITEGWTP